MHFSLSFHIIKFINIAKIIPSLHSCSKTFHWSLTVHKVWVPHPCIQGLPSVAPTFLSKLTILPIPLIFPHLLLLNYLFFLKLILSILILLMQFPPYAIIFLIFSLSNPTCFPWLSTDVHITSSLKSLPYSPQLEIISCSSEFLDHFI